MNPIPATPVSGWPESGAPVVPGSFFFATWHDTDIVSSIVLFCPCGCGGASSFLIESAHARLTEPGRSMWTWDGNRERPTLHPSLQRTFGCRWHGWLRDGVFVEAA